MKVRKPFILFFLVVLIISAGSFSSRMFFSNVSPESVMHRLKPAIVDKPSQNVLVVEAKGDPNATLKPAFKLLFGTYFKIKGVQKGKGMQPPRARWPLPYETPKNEWVGLYALPLPDAVKDLPKVKVPAGLSVKLDTWSYGTVAEILHMGAYKSEDTTVAKLKAFIAERGFEISGDHEEEYLRGPGLLPGKPEKYLTIIRYGVRKVVVDSVGIARVSSSAEQ